MGCYDCITFRCPACGKEIIAQSKSGDCELESYKFTSVPISVAYDANRHAPFECVCGFSWIFGNLPDSNKARVSLSILKETD